MDDTHFYAGLDSASTSATSRENFRVVVRVRPPLPRELHGYRPFVDVVQLSDDQANTITLCDALDTEDGRGAVYSRQSYTFDRVYGADTTQEELYDVSARPAVLSVLDGYNATLMAYGQTGTGKTYTMEGFTNEEERGVIPRAVEDVFAVIHERRSASPNTRFLVRASYMQIYNEVISDLLDMPPHSALGSGGGSGRSSLAVRHTPQRGVYVDGLSEWVVRSPEDVYGLIAKGTALRATSATKLSELSSRSHAIFTIVVEAMEGDEANPQAYRFGKLHIVDLAGSEKIRLAGVTGQRLEETKNINKSLHELGNVIAALAAKSSAHSRRGGAPPRHIPFRNSALTSALRDSLGGNCKTTLVACISPALESYAESLSTLMFANRAKNIQTHAVVNAGVNQSTLLRAYEQELLRLRQQLQERTAADAAVEASLAGGSLDTSGRLFAMEEDRRRAEQDRAAALAALQQSSVAYQEELRIREGLEGRIVELEAVLREGGMEGNPRTSDEYAERLLELDRERQAVAEDKEQVERYKHLLLKQRDIMLSLTTRLNDRDETILLLQEEVDAYDRHVQSLEEELEAVLQEGGGSGAEDGERRPPSFLVNAQRVGRLSEAQAFAYVQQLRTGQDTASGSNNTSVNGSAAPPAFKYRSLLQPTRTITAEQLAIELVMLQGRCEPVSNATSPRSAASSNSSSHRENNNTSGTGMRGTTQEASPVAAPSIPGLSEAELTTLMRQRADNIVRSHYDQVVAQLRCTVAELTLQLRNSEDKAAVTEKAVDQLVRRQRNGAAEVEGPRGATAGTAATSDGVSEIRAALQREWESRHNAYVAAIDALHDAARTDGVERARLGREVDRLRLEVQHLLESTIGSSSASGSQHNHHQQQQQHSSVAAAARQAWQRLQEVEERVRRHGVLAQLPQLNSAPTASTSHERGENETLRRESLAREAALTANVQRLEREAAALRSALDANRPSSSLLTTTATAATTTAVDGPAATAGEVARLRQQLLVHEKDRRALRTILEQRMRGKIDRICEMVASESASPTGSGGKLGSEARSLQGLIHASIKAMDVDV